MRRNASQLPALCEGPGGRTSTSPSDTLPAANTRAMTAYAGSSTEVNTPISALDPENRQWTETTWAQSSVANTRLGQASAEVGASVQGLGEKNIQNPRQNERWPGDPGARPSSVDVHSWEGSFNAIRQLNQPEGRGTSSGRWRELVPQSSIVVDHGGLRKHCIWKGGQYTASYTRVWPMFSQRTADAVLPEGRAMNTAKRARRNEEKVRTP